MNLELRLKKWYHILSLKYFELGGDFYISKNVYPHRTDLRRGLGSGPDKYTGGRQQSRDAGDITTTYNYNNDNTYASFYATKGWSTHMPELSYDYDYDANKNVTSEARGTAGTAMADYSWTSAFDTDDRITQFDRQNGETRSWELDKIGNISSFTLNGEKEMRTFNAVNELVKVKGKPKLKYDAKGNLTKGHDRKKLTWDIDNHLASISASGAKLLATYTYDALGRRVSKTTRTTKKGKGKGKGHDSHGNGNGNGHDSHGNGNGYGHHDHDTVTTTYVCHGNQVIEEYVNGAYAKCYAYGAYIDDCVASIGLPAPGSTLPAITTYHRDRQFNTIGLTDSTGGVENLCAYTPYGDFAVTDASGTDVDVSTIDNEYWYTGRRLDKESGLWYFRARYFDSEMGTFISRDPLGFVDGQGLYNGYFAMRFMLDPLGKNRFVIDPNAIKACNCCEEINISKPQSKEEGAWYDDELEDEFVAGDCCKEIQCCNIDVTIRSRAIDFSLPDVPIATPIGRHYYIAVKKRQNSCFEYDEALDTISGTEVGGKTESQPGMDIGYIGSDTFMDGHAGTIDFGEGKNACDFMRCAKKAARLISRKYGYSNLPPQY